MYNHASKDFLFSTLDKMSDGDFADTSVSVSVFSINSSNNYMREIN